MASDLQSVNSYSGDTKPILIHSVITKWQCKPLHVWPTSQWITWHTNWSSIWTRLSCFSFQARHLPSTASPSILRTLWCLWLGRQGTWVWHWMPRCPFLPTSLRQHAPENSWSTPSRGCQMRGPRADCLPSWLHDGGIGSPLKESLHIVRREWKLICSDFILAHGKTTLKANCF